MDSRIIAVVFDGNPREYHFISYIDVRPGDMVVVDTRNGFALATVSSDYVPESIKATREVVALVDMHEYNERRARESRVAELREKMDAKVHKLQEFAVYEMLAKQDQELASMLDELKRLL